MSLNLSKLKEIAGKFEYVIDEYKIGNHRAYYCEYRLNQLYSELSDKQEGTSQLDWDHVIESNDHVLFVNAANRVLEGLRSAAEKELLKVRGSRLTPKAKGDEIQQFINLEIKSIRDALSNLDVDLIATRSKGGQLDVTGRSTASSSSDVSLVSRGVASSAATASAPAPASASTSPAAIDAIAADIVRKQVVDPLADILGKARRTMDLQKDFTQNELLSVAEALVRLDNISNHGMQNIEELSGSDMITVADHHKYVSANTARNAIRLFSVDENFNSLLKNIYSINIYKEQMSEAKGPEVFDFNEMLNCQALIAQCQEQLKAKDLPLTKESKKNINTILADAQQQLAHQLQRYKEYDLKAFNIMYDGVKSELAQKSGMSFPGSVELLEHKHIKKIHDLAKESDASNGIKKFSGELTSLEESHVECKSFLGAIPQRFIAMRDALLDSVDSKTSLLAGMVGVALTGAMLVAAVFSAPLLAAAAAGGVVIVGAGLVAKWCYDSVKGFINAKSTLENEIATGLKKTFYERAEDAASRQNQGSDLTGAQAALPAGSEANAQNPGSGSQSQTTSPFEALAKNYEATVKQSLQAEAGCS
ncbi:MULTISPECIES: hypothetical protein [Cysteiniphilum]|uniref:hypothetical protein n=1 Tax=Cysteiniphilum TaxID=2056696 RepID=UPI0017828449|nr:MULTISPECIES: hypothetical protein [Cysteiniphilum]